MQNSKWLLMQNFASSKYYKFLSLPEFPLSNKAEKTKKGFVPLLGFSDGDIWAFSLGELFDSSVIVDVNYPVPLIDAL